MSKERVYLRMSHMRRKSRKPKNGIGMYEQRSFVGKTSIGIVLLDLESHFIPIDIPLEIAAYKSISAQYQQGFHTREKFGALRNGFLLCERTQLKMTHTTSIVITEILP